MDQDPSTISDLSELITLIDSLPEEFQGDFKEALERANENLDRRRKILVFIQEAMSQLRLDMKYLMFDLEATRRERDDLHRQIRDLME